MIQYIFRTHYILYWYNIFYVIAFSFLFIFLYFSLEAIGPLQTIFVRFEEIWCSFFRSTYDVCYSGNRYIKLCNELISPVNQNKLSVAWNHVFRIDVIITSTYACICIIILLLCAAVAQENVRFSWYTQRHVL